MSNESTTPKAVIKCISRFLPSANLLHWIIVQIQIHQIAGKMNGCWNLGEYIAGKVECF